MPLSPHDPAAVLRGLSKLLPPERVSHSEADRMVYSRDMWPRTMLSLHDNLPSIAPPDLIVWPETTAEVVAIVELAARMGAPLIPFGAGSGVCGGTLAKTGGVAVDLKRMNRVEWISREDHLARFEAGILGQTLEDELNLFGLTLGHFPSSIYCSTLGGWIATRSAGQCSSRYGKIEDMIESIEVVLGDGRVVECGPTQMPQLASTLVGSEGTLGIVTRATMRIWPLPPHRVLRGYQLHNVAQGCEAMRRVMQRGLQPAVVRLYDEMDTMMARPSASHSPDRSLFVHSAAELLPAHLSDLGANVKQQLIRTALGRAGLLSRVAETLLPRMSSGCLLILGFEGERRLAEVEASLAHGELTALGAKDLGAEPGLKWHANRYSISYKASPLFAAGSFVDTMDVVTTWDRLLDLYTDVRAALAGQALVLAHFSHAYPEGCSIYFTFAAAAETRAQSEALYDEIWQRGLSAATRAGGVTSHHHGVGLSKASFMLSEHGAGMNVLRQLKQLLDPAGILNPGKIGL